jgi:glycosyltransferase involved in cell wall biosynthesis
MKAVFLGNTFPDDPVHLQALAQEIDLTVYGTTFKLTSFTPSSKAKTPASKPWKVGQDIAKPPPGCNSRVFKPLMRIRRGSIFWIYPGLAKALAADAPDVVHVASEPWGALALHASWWCERHPGTALLIHGTERRGHHGPMPERWGKQLFSRFVLSRSTGYVGESSGAVELARRTGLSSMSPTAVIHGNPRDPRLFRPPSSDEEKRGARRSLGLPEGGIAVGFLGRLSPHKGPLLFIDAARRIHEGTDVWNVVGGIGPLQAEVESRARNGGIRYLSGLRFPDQVAAFYQSVDIFVVPSWRTGRWDEQGPRAIIEAMMSSCLVVGSDCGSIPDMLGDCGIIVKQNDVDDLARGIADGVRRMNDSDLRERARTRAVAEYSGEAVAAKLLRIWRETSARGSGVGEPRN